MMDREAAVAALLADPHCDCLAPDDSGWTPFVYAVRMEAVSCALLLLKRGSGTATGGIAVVEASAHIKVRSVEISVTDGNNDLLPVLLF